MKIDTIREFLQSGKKPLVKFTDILWDEAFGEKGMVAQITMLEDIHNDVVKIYFDYSVAKEHNLALQGHDYYLKGSDKTGTAFEAGVMDEDDFTEHVYFDPNDEVPVELVVDSPAMDGYLKAIATMPANEKHPTYVEWLETYYNKTSKDTAILDWIADKLISVHYAIHNVLTVTYLDQEDKTTTRKFPYPLMDEKIVLRNAISDIMN